MRAALNQCLGIAVIFEAQGLIMGSLCILERHIACVFGGHESQTPRLYLWLVVTQRFKFFLQRPISDKGIRIQA